MTKQKQSIRLYQAVERLALQAGEDTDEAIDWLCGEHGGMAKLFEKYFSPTPPAAPVQDDIPKIGCVNHDCDKCKAAAPVREDWGPGPHEYHSLPESGPERPAIPTVITCPFCASEHVPGWLHDLNMDRGAYGERPAQRKPLTYDKTELNCFAQDLYDQKMREGKHGHYESMFHVIHQCVKKVASPPAQRKPLTDEEIGNDPIFRAGVRFAESKHGIGEKK